MNNHQTADVDFENLSKKDRRRKKKEQKKLRRKNEARKRQLVKWGWILGIIFLFSSGFFFFKNFKNKTYEKAPKIEITSSKYDFGKISASKGTVEASFEIKSAGASPLEISGMETSCGCTKAKLKIQNEELKIIESPEFGMHNNPTDWSAFIDPGRTAELIVTFDPNFHEDTFGPITRTISIFSNDPLKKKAEILVYANVMK